MDRARSGTRRSRAKTSHSHRPAPASAACTGGASSAGTQGSPAQAAPNACRGGAAVTTVGPAARAEEPEPAWALLTRKARPPPPQVSLLRFKVARSRA